MRKKFTMLLMTLLAFSGAMKAQTGTEVIASANGLSDGTMFVASTDRGGWAVDKEGTKFGATGELGFETKVTQQVFQIEEIDDAKYLYSVYAEKYVTYNGTLVDDIESAQAIVFTDLGDKTFVAKFGNDQFINIGGNLKIEINSWGSGAQYDAGNKVTITSITDEKVFFLAKANELLTVVRDNIENSTMGAYSQTTADNLNAAINAPAATAETLKAAIDAVSLNMPEAGKYYLIKSAYPVFAEKQGKEMAIYSNYSSSKLSWAALNDKDAAFYWTITPKGDGTYVLQNFGDVNFVPAIKSERYSMTGKQANAQAFILKCLKPSQFNITGSGTMHAGGHSEGTGTGGEILDWDGNADSQSAWTIVEADLSSKNYVTYNFKYNGATKYTRNIFAEIGSEFPDYTITLPSYVTAAEKPAEFVSAENLQKDIALGTEGLPFTPADSYNEIEHWYYMKIKSYSYLYYDAKEDHIPTTTATIGSSKDNYTWAFVGNPFDGFSIVNFTAGGTMVLSAPVAPTENANTNQLARMVVGSVAEGNTSWDCIKANDDGGFYVQHPTEPTYAFNLQGGNVCYWNGRDGGSVLQLEERPMGAEAELLDLINKSKEIESGNGIGEYTEESVNALNDAVAAAQDVIDGDEEVTSVHLSALQNVFDALAINLPEAGKYYRIVSVATKNSRGSNVAIIADQANNRVVWNAYGEDPNFDADINNLWSFVDAGDGKYNLKAANGRYLGAVQGNSRITALTDEQNAGDYTLGIYTPGICKLYHSGGVSLANYIWADGVGTQSYNLGVNVICGWEEGANSNSAWKIVEATSIECTLSNINNEGYASVYLPFDVTLDEDVTAYAITGAANGYATLTEKQDIKANQGAILIGTPGAHTFGIATASSDWTGNMLTGTTVNTYVKGDAYVLANGTNGVGLYKAELNKDAEGNAAAGGETGTHFLNNANKAYLVVEGAKAPMFSFDRGEGTTGIENSEVTTQKSPLIYDLLGRRVEKMEKGIYIVNGKKVIR